METYLEQLSTDISSLAQTLKSPPTTQLTKMNSRHKGKHVAKTIALDQISNESLLLVVETSIAECSNQELLEQRTGQRSGVGVTVDGGDQATEKRYGALEQQCAFGDGDVSD